MIKRHEDALMARIDALAWRGITEIEWWELKAWYGMERITKTIWKDIADRFTEAMDGENHDRLRIIECAERVIVINGASAKLISEKM